MKRHAAPTRNKSALPTLAVTVGVTLALIGGTSFAANAVTSSHPTQSTQQAVSANLAAGSETLWGTTAPPQALVDSDTHAVELGTTFTPSVSGTITGVQFWKTAENGGTHVGNLWDSAGKRLATAKFSGESANGWQTVKFATPVSVTAGQKYVASYLAPQGRYVATTNVTSPTLSSALLSVPATNSGVYAYGQTSAFPRSTWKSSGYWVDVLFTPATGAVDTPTQPIAPAPAPTTPPVAPAPAPTTPPVAPTPAPTTPPVAPPTTDPGAGSTHGSFAGSTNTGPSSAGFNPTEKYTGPSTITQAGTVITNKVIPAGLRIEADDVTVQGNIIEGPTDISWDQAAVEVIGARAKVLNNVIRGKSATDWTQTPVSAVKIRGDATEFKGNNVYWIAGDGLSLYGSNSKIVGNWIHDFVDRADVHYDALHYPVDSITSAGLLQDNTVELWTNGGMTSALSFPDVASKIVVDHNLIAGGNYAIMGGGSGITISNNLFWTKFSSNVGVYGTNAHMGAIGTVNWTNNSMTNDGVTSSGTAPLQ